MSWIAKLEDYAQRGLSRLDEIIGLLREIRTLLAQERGT